MIQPALGYHQLVSYNHNHDIKADADFHLLRGFSCSNTTPTITIFVPLLFDKAVSMLKHIMEIVKGNTEFINADQNPLLGVFH